MSVSDLGIRSRATIDGRTNPACPAVLDRVSARSLPPLVVGYSARG